MPDKQESTIEVPSSSDDKKKEKSTTKKKSGKEVLDPESELSEEDKKLKDKLDLFVLRIQDNDYNIAKIALSDLKNEIRQSTSSMTSVPKPLKFLKDEYNNIKKFYNNNILKLKNKEIIENWTDLMSILAMTMEDPSTRQCLKYRISCNNNNDDMINWGNQYIKHLCAEIRIEMDERLLNENNINNNYDLINFNDILLLVKKIVIFYMDNNSEPEACDLLLEVEKLDMLKEYTKEHNHERVCEYLRSCASYLPSPEDINIYKLIFDIYLKFKNFYHAMRFALKLDNIKLVRYVMRYLENRPIMKKQCAYLLGWHQFGYDDDYEIENDELLEYPINKNDLIPEKWENENDDDIKQDNNNIVNDNNEDDDEDDDIEINEIIANTQLSEAFHNLARDLDVLDPKDAETDIFKEQLLDNVNTNANVISARKSLAISYVNAFIHAGYGKDKYMCNEGDLKKANEWIAKNKDKGQLASIASIGSIMLWDEEAVNLVDRYFGAENENQIRAGAYLAIGMSCSGMRSESGVGLALLQKPIENENGKQTTLERITSIFGLGMAYAGQENNDIFDVLSPCISIDEPDELSSIAALSLGLVYVGTCNEEISNIIIFDLIERSEKDNNKLNDSIYLYNALGLGLLFLQRREKVETALEAVQAFNDINKKYTKTLKYTLEALAYAGTGSVLKIQKFMSIVGEHYDNIKDTSDDDDKKDTKKEKDGEKDNNNKSNEGGNENESSSNKISSNPFETYKEEKKEEKKEENNDENNNENEIEKELIEDNRYYQNIALLGISLISMGEDLSLDMSIRMYNHFIQYGNIRIKRNIPLALALQFVSNPRLQVADILSKLSHDHDIIVSCNAIISLGIIGAGTNNSRIATMLRDLTNYYNKENDHLYIIRISQGLLHMGKGLLTINPYHSDRFLLSKVSLCGILTLIYNLFDLKKNILGNRHWMLYSLIMSMKPRMLITFNKKCKNIKINVRVGQALDVVGKAGKPQRITGFQTHETPVLLGYKDRAQLANNDYISCAPILEGFAICRKNNEINIKNENKKDNKKKKSI